VSVGACPRFCIEVAASSGFKWPRVRAHVARARATPLAVLMPAHNESLVIRDTLMALTAQLRPGDQVLVVADNCSDNTAQIARDCGATVVERQHETLKGKGYALDHGVRALESMPDAPQFVVIVDADCLVHAGSLDALFDAHQSTGRPVQAIYLMESGPDNRAVSPISVFAWRVRNLVRPVGLKLLGGPCHLTGSGMGFSLEQLKQIPLASGHLVEDMQMGVDLAIRGQAPLLATEALVTSVFPVSVSGADAQRTRWEHGALGMLFSAVPRLMAAGFRGRGQGVFAMALDTLVPPLALLVMLLVALFALSGVHGLLTSDWRPWLSASLLLLAFATLVLLAWWRFGRDLISLSMLLRVPLYAVSKVPIYLRFAMKRQVEWVRSKRDAD